MNIKRTAILKWVLGIFGALVLLLGVAAFYLSQHWKPIISEKLKKAVYEGSDGLYRITFKDLSLNLLTGYVALQEPALVPDTAVYGQLIQAGKAPLNLFTVRVKKIALSGTSPLKAWMNKEIVIGEILVQQPQVSRLSRARTRADTAQEARTLYQRISKSFTSIAVQKIRIVDAALQTAPYGSKAKPFTLKKLTLLVSDLLIDSASQTDRNRFYAARDVSFLLKDYSVLTPDGMYRMTLPNLEASTAAKQVRIRGFSLTPQYPEMQFSRKYAVQHDRYVMAVPEITLSGIDFNRYDEDDRLLARSLLVERARIRVFLNRSLPPPAIDKWVNFPHVILQKLKINTLLDTLKIRNSRIDYKEHNPGSGQSGSLYFSNLNATVRNVTNDSASLRKNSRANAELSARLYGSVPLNVFINFNLTDPAGAFSYSGSVANLDLKLLNPLNKALSLVEVKSGYVSKAAFNVSANRYGSTGTLKLYYRDLAIRLLKKDEEDGRLKKKGLLSFVANTVLVKDNNPSKGEPLRVSTATFERPHSSSFFNLLWKGVFVCIKESVGLGIVKDKKAQPAEKKKEIKKE